MKEFVRSYLATALWSSSDSLPGYDEERDGYTDHMPLDNYIAETGQRLSLGVIKAAIKDCKLFIHKAINELEIHEDEVFKLSYADSSEGSPIVAHDFWLTRNYHGAGFWDGDYEEPLGTQFTELSHKFPPIDLYIGDDGRIYQ